ncbi:MAG: sigma-70 family RNA polymerase sigma factor [Pseudomonadota bacterium]
MSDARGLSATEWQDLYRRLEKPLYNFAFRYVWSAQDAEDVVHDAFLQIWERREHTLVATADRYIWVTALNRCRKLRRWARLKCFVQIEDSLHEVPAAENVETEAAHREEEVGLRAAIERLPERLRAVLLLAEFSDMSYEAIAQLLSIPAGTVASRRHLAVKQLREWIRSTDR